MSALPGSGRRRRRRQRPDSDRSDLSGGCISKIPAVETGDATTGGRHPSQDCSEWPVQGAIMWD